MNSNKSKNAQCLIFTNLPFELECIILNYYKEIREDAWHDTLKMFSRRKVMRELYNECVNKNNFGDSFGDSSLSIYKQEIFRIYSKYIPYSCGSSNNNDFRLDEYSTSEGHSMINLGILLNSSVQDRIMTLHYVTPHTLIEHLDRRMRSTDFLSLDSYDFKLVFFWNNVDILKKEQLIRHYFLDIKQDFIKNYGIVNSDNLIYYAFDCAYRILRFGLINNSELFK